MDELREAFDEAFEELEQNEAPEVEAQAEEPEQSDAHEGEQDGEEAQEVEAQAEEAEVAEGAPEPTQTKTTDKAPQSWSPKAREAWGSLPEDTRAQISKREREVNQVLKDTSQARQFMSRMDQVLQPHKESLMASGVRDPLEAVGNLLAAESTLRVGSQSQKAQAMARMINEYGIDIATLDSALSGQNPEENTNSQLEKLLEERLAPVNQYLQQQQYAQQQAQLNTHREASQSVEEFSKQAEFLPDVRNDMANLIDAATARGETLSLQKAYDIACAVHPEISQIMGERKKQQAIMGNSQNIASKRTAASSIRGTQGGSGGGNPNLSLRDQIANAWEDQIG